MPRDHHIVSVIVPTVGRATLEQCKAALAKQTRPPDEVIISIDHERRGASWARNEGIKQARGDLIALTDDDCEPPENWLEQLIQTMDEYDAGVVGGIYSDIDPLLQARQRRKSYPQSPQIDVTGDLTGITGHIMYRRAWLDRLITQDGYVFNEIFKTTAGEDSEVYWRLRRAGARAVFIPLRVTHLRRVTPLGFLRFQFNRGLGISLLFRLHRQSKTDVPLHSSFLWGNTGTITGARWVAAVWHKVLGPFDVNSFPDFRSFLLFWLGEKFEGAGFLWGLLSLEVAEPRKLPTSSERL